MCPTFKCYMGQSLGLHVYLYNFNKFSIFTLVSVLYSFDIIINIGALFLPAIYREDGYYNQIMALRKHRGLMPQAYTVKENNPGEF